MIRTATACVAVVFCAFVAPAQTPVPTEPVGTQQGFIRRATIDDTLEVTGEPVAAKQVETRMTVDVAVNGQGPFRFVVDSGADRTVIGMGLAQRLGLPAGEAVLVHSMGASRTVPTVRIDRLRIGANSMTGIVAPVLAEENIGAQGLIGIDALSGQRLTLDFEHKTITVQDTRVAERVSRGDDEIVVTARRRKGQLILTQAKAGKVDLAAVIDSGAEITIGNAALRRQVVRARAAVSTIKLVSVTGEDVVADLVILPEVRIGGIVMRNLPVAFADVPPFRLFGLVSQPAVLLGTDVMQGFRRVSLDFRNRRVRFVLHRQP
ncbi:aspartyl protease family protein [uncultured Sphingomonas sp.]|uniref:aspartyl protease family protein n=1 Tax=uncultured Sphingomonas sp. TaxID=158754 RepID=UPI0025D482FC|nr:aspartyl protease family protein [uncultured Sphingomonas sp.]